MLVCTERLTLLAMRRTSACKAAEGSGDRHARPWSVQREATSTLPHQSMLRPNEVYQQHLQRSSSTSKHSKCCRSTRPQATCR